ncbi:putative sodium bile acid cotransporter [Pelagophyceae sp. CCMP2097]|nr:putative sodium bile acid cotransporter [Pelagophyceae sp. CCMP2097]
MDHSKKDDSMKLMDGTVSRQRALLAYLRKNWMLLGVAAAILGARQAPWVGAKGGPLLPEYTVKYGCVSIIFFLSGMSLKPQQLKGAVTNIPLHCLIQGFTLFCIPCFVCAVVAPVLRRLGFNPWLLQGIKAMSCMPPPVSSAVILTKAAGGNEAAAIFNSAFGSLLGIIVTPIELLLVIESKTGGVNSDRFSSFVGTLLNIFQQLTVTVLLPLVLGQLARPKVSAWLERTKPPLSEIGQMTLLVIIYTTFCDSFLKPSDVSDPMAVVHTAMIVVCLQLTFIGTVFLLTTTRRGISMVGQFAPADVVCVLFCGTHKSLTLGIPVLQIVFRDHPFLPTITAPLLMYHPVQIVLGGLLVPSVKDWMLREVPLTAGTYGARDQGLDSV